MRENGSSQGRRVAGRTVITSRWCPPANARRRSPGIDRWSVCVARHLGVTDAVAHEGSRRAQIPGRPLRRSMMYHLSSRLPEPSPSQHRGRGLHRRRDLSVPVPRSHGHRSRDRSPVWPREGPVAKTLSLLARSLRLAATGRPGLRNLRRVYARIKPDAAAELALCFGPNLAALSSCPPPCTFLPAGARLAQEPATHPGIRLAGCARPTERYALVPMCGREGGGGGKGRIFLHSYWFPEDPSRRSPATPPASPAPSLFP